MGHILWECCPPHLWKPLGYLATDADLGGSARGFPPSQTLECCEAITESEERETCPIHTQDPYKSDTGSESIPGQAGPGLEQPGLVKHNKPWQGME